jgi:hypothetical protein
MTSGRIFRREVITARDITVEDRARLNGRSRVSCKRPGKGDMLRQVR